MANNWGHTPKPLLAHVKVVKGGMSWYVFYLRCVAAAYPKDGVIQKALATAGKTGGLPGGVECVHYWEITSPSGPASKGVCKLCGATAIFKNGYAAMVDGLPYSKRFSLRSNRQRR